jgi:hypothetical protein
MRKLLLMLALTFPAFPQALFFGLNGTAPGGGAHILCHGVGATGSGATTTATSTGGSCSGATRIDVGITYAGSPCTISDSSGNSYTLAHAVNSGAGVLAAVYFKYSPTTTASMTWTCAGSSTFPMINVIVWGGTATSGSAPTGTNIGGTGGASGTSVTAGPLTPTVPNAVCFTELMTAAAEGGKVTISSPFTIEDSSPHASNNVGGFDAYQIQTTATMENPTYSWPSSIGNAAAGACLP